MDYELVIIGAGPAGCGAALYGAREGLTTLLLEPAAPGGQMSVTAWVENYPGVPGTSGPQLAEAMLAGAKAAGATFLQAQVTGLSLSGTPKTVETTAGTYTAGAVILAMGAAPENLPLPEAEGFLGRGLSYCATCDGMFFQGKTVAVLGGGNGAAASARSLARLCSQVHVIFRKDAMGADAREQEALAACSNVKLHPGTLLTGLSGQDQLGSAHPWRTAPPAPPGNSHARDSLPPSAASRKRPF
ncbi:MAG: NAD(P)/FAD-dependent oxidoreductase [Oscillospiraceae bacterium]